jgi:nitrogenase molybdenum-iron protein alpha chain
MALHMNLSPDVPPLTREERLGSITGYAGTIKDLNRRIQCGAIANTTRDFSQATSCPNACAVGQILMIRDAAVIFHSPVGCQSLACANLWLENRLCDMRGMKYDSHVLGTDLGEADTILGATADLKDAIEKTWERYHPAAIFIAASCVSGIIGEDMEAVAQAADVPVPVVIMHCEGFKSGIWASGFDAADHAVLANIVKPPEKKRNVVNFKNFRASARKDIEEIFRRIGVDEVQFILATSTIEELSRISEARATVSICSTLGCYLGNGLEQLYGVPYIQTLNPIGITGFEAWLRQIGKVIGEEEKVEAYIAEERAYWIPKIEEAKKPLKGLRVVLGMGASFAFQVSRVIQELDMELVHTMAWHLDPEYDNGVRSTYIKHLAEEFMEDDFDVNIADQQNYELYSILKKHKPDMYLGRHPGNVVWAIKQGIPSLFMVEEFLTFGYDRFYQFIQILKDLLINRSFEDKFAAHIKLPYTEWWQTQEYSAMYREAEAN